MQFCNFICRNMQKKCRNMYQICTQHRFIAVSIWLQANALLVNHGAFDCWWKTGWAIIVDNIRDSNCSRWSRYVYHAWTAYRFSFEAGSRSKAKYQEDYTVSIQERDCCGITSWRPICAYKNVELWPKCAISYGHCQTTRTRIIETSLKSHSRQELR